MWLMFPGYPINQVCGPQTLQVFAPSAATIQQLSEEAGHIVVYAGARSKDGGMLDLPRVPLREGRAPRGVPLLRGNVPLGGAASSNVG